MQLGRSAAVLCALVFGFAGATKPSVATKATTKHAAKPAVATKAASKGAAKPDGAAKPAVGKAVTKHAAKPAIRHPPKADVTPAKAPAKPKLSKEAREKAAQNALPQLQSIMAHAQSALARAEKHHEKAVKKARGKVEVLFQEQAKLAGALVAKYSSELDQATRELSAVINASKAELVAEEAAEAKNASAGWGGEAMEERARAGAKADAALRELRHLERKRNRDVEDATRHALEPIEYAAQKLSRKVGDLSSISDDAKATLEWAAKQGASNTSDAKLNIAKDANAVEKAVEAARNASAKKLEAADTELAKGLANATNATKAGLVAIEKSLVDTEKEEIKRVRR